MGLTQPKRQFGIHSVAFYDRITRVPLSYLRVLGEASLNFTGEFVDLQGGSQLFPWDSEVSNITSEISFTARELPFSTMEVLTGGTSTLYDAEVSGEIVDAENVKGESVYTSTGIGSIAITSADELKEGIYTVKATGTSTFTLYGFTDLSFNDGTDLSFVDDTLAIQSGIIDTDTSTAITNFGLSLVGGAETTAFVSGDTMQFTVRRGGTVSGLKLIVGQSGVSAHDMGMIIAGQKGADGSRIYVDMFRVRVLGMPLSFKERAFGEWSITLKALYDSTRNGVFKYIYEA